MNVGKRLAQLLQDDSKQASEQDSYKHVPLALVANSKEKIDSAGQNTHLYVYRVRKQKMRIGNGTCNNSILDYSFKPTTAYL